MSETIVLSVLLSVLLSIACSFAVLYYIVRTRLVKAAFSIIGKSGGGRPKADPEHRKRAQQIVEGLTNEVINANPIIAKVRQLVEENTDYELDAETMLAIMELPITQRLLQMLGIVEGKITSGLAGGLQNILGNLLGGGGQTASGQATLAPIERVRKSQ